MYDPCTGLNIRAADGTTSDELAAIDLAIAHWQAVYHVEMSRKDSAFEQTLDIRFEEAALVFRGVYQDEVGDVIVNRRLRSASDLAITVAHELGHAFGLPHIDNRDSVMNKGNLVFVPLSTDADALGSLWGPCVLDALPQQSVFKPPNVFKTHTQR